MCAEQRETILVLLDLLYRNLPSLDRMALFARRTKLALVNIGMAIGASLTHVGEDRLDMALRASHTLVHAAERVPRLAVIKLRNVADRFPSTKGMAILARDVQWAMRAARIGVVLRDSGNCGCEQQQRHDQIDQIP
jgi:hypothetical protein